MAQRIQINKQVSFHCRSDKVCFQSRFCSSLFLLVTISVFISSCATNRLINNIEGPAVEPLIPGVPVFTIYAVGDAGLDNTQSKAVLGQLASIATDDTHPGMILFLGDNIYPAGFAPPSEPAEYEYSKMLLKRQTDTLNSYAGQIIFIPGNHDWNEFKAGGLEAVLRQSEFIKNLHDPRVRMLPDNGCSGPVALLLGDDVVLLILDTQWWFQNWNKEPGINQGCEVQSRELLKEKIQALVREHKGKRFIMAMHHPLYSQGNHGGHFSFRDHIFPLTKIVPWLWIPLPVIGSIYPGYRSLIGHPQDLSNSKYKSLKETILEGMEYDGDLIFLSGHEHNLQYIREGKHHQIISGSGSKSSQVADGDNLVYGHRAAGFIELNYYSNNVMQLTVYEVDEYHNTHAIILRQSLAGQLNP